MTKSKTVLKKILHLGGIDVTRYDQSAGLFRDLFEKYKDFTMIPQELFIANLELCYHYRHIDGDYVECGVWRGGMSGAIAEILVKEKTLHLFDSFEGLPPAQEIDGKEALAWQEDINASGYFNNCSAEEAYAIKAMALANRQSYKIYKGWFGQTLPDFNSNTIGILRLDGDWYDSTMTCLNSLFPLVTNGGVILLDDYYTWDGCSRAVHDYLAKMKSPSRVHQWNNRIGYIIKKS